MTDKDSLAKVCADLRALKGNTLDYVARIERLDAEMRREQVYVGSGNVFRDLELPDPECRQQLADANIELAAIRAHSNELSLFTERLEDELAACRLLLSLPRVRALFPPLPDGAVLASCSGPVYSQAVPDCIKALQEALDETKKSNSPTVKLPTWDAEEIIRRYGK